MGLLSILWQFNICGWVIRERHIIKGLQHIRNEDINLTSENFLGCGFLKSILWWELELEFTISWWGIVLKNNLLVFKVHIMTIHEEDLDTSRKGTWSDLIQSCAYKIVCQIGVVCSCKSTTNVRGKQLSPNKHMIWGLFICNVWMINLCIYFAFFLVSKLLFHVDQSYRVWEY
jgi:hypothetical protein